MAVLLKWSRRMLRDNPLHTLFTVLNMVFSYALLTGVKLFVRYCISSDFTDGDGMLWYLAAALAVAIFLLSGLTMHNAFVISIHERRPRYDLLSAAGATKRQIRGSLFLEALIINVIGAVLGIALGMAGFIIWCCKWSGAEASQTAAVLKEAFRFLTELIPRQDAEGFAPTSLRGLYVLLPEFCTVPTAMWVAAGKHLQHSKRAPVRFRRPKRVETTRWEPWVRRVFLSGGVLNRRMDKRDRARSRMFLSAILVSIVTIAMLCNVLPIFLKPSSQANTLYLRTFDDDPAMEQRLDQFLTGDDFGKTADGANYYRVYTPRVYCVLPETQIAQNVRDTLQRKNVRRQVFLYPMRETKQILAPPQFVFMRDPDYARICCLFAEGSDADALLLPGRGADGKELVLLNPEETEQTWTLRFYDTDRRYVIDDARTRKAKRIRDKEDEQTAKGERVISRKIKENYSCKTPQAYCQAVEGHVVEEKQIRVKAVHPEREGVPSPTGSWDFDRAVPTLVFPESARRTYARHLQNTGEGLRLRVETKVGDEVGAELHHTLRGVLLTDLDGYIAEHPFATGTRYAKGEALQDHTQPENTQPDAKKTGMNPFLQTMIDRLRMIVKVIVSPLQRFFEQFFYSAPQPICADLYPVFRMAKAVNIAYVIIIWFTLPLVLFTVFTNCTNVVFAHHILRRREYAVLQSCGMDEKQMRRAITYEAVWYGVHSMLAGFVRYFVLCPFVMLAVMYLASYERIPSLAPAEWWLPDLAANIVNAGNMAINKDGILYALQVFPLAGAAIFLLFILINFIVRRRLRKGDLIELLKKEL